MYLEEQMNKNLEIGANLHGGNALPFKRFCESRGYSVSLIPNSILLFGNNDSDTIMALWQDYTEPGRTELLERLGI
jgi:hypothetical protein